MFPEKTSKNLIAAYKILTILTRLKKEAVAIDGLFKEQEWWISKGKCNSRGNCEENNTYPECSCDLKFLVCRGEWNRM